MIHFDFRTKFLFLIEMNILIFMLKGTTNEIITILYCSAILMIDRKTIFVIKTDIVFSIMFAIEALLKFYNSSSFFISLIIFVTVILRKFIPLFMIGKMIFSTKVGEFIACMYKLKMPKDFIIAISVIFRYFPTILEEWQSIIISMKMRGIGLSFFNIIAHPLKSIEYMLVPLLINQIKIGEELSQAALCRGLDNDKGHTSLIQVKMKLHDYIALFIPAAYFILEKVK